MGTVPNSDELIEKGREAGECGTDKTPRGKRHVCPQGTPIRANARSLWTGGLQCGHRPVAQGPSRRRAQWASGACPSRRAPALAIDLGLALTDATTSPRSPAPPSSAGLGRPGRLATGAFQISAIQPRRPRRRSASRSRSAASASSATGSVASVRDAGRCCSC